MALLLKDILDGSFGQDQMRNNLMAARTSLEAEIKKKSRKTDIAFLEKYLNEIFFDDSQKGNLARDYYDRAAQGFLKNSEDRITQIFNSFSFRGDVQRASGFYERGKTGKISSNTLNSAIIKLESQLKDIENALNGKKRTQKLDQQLTQLKNLTERARETLNLELSKAGKEIGQYFDSKSGDKISKLINQLRGASAFLSQNSSLTEMGVQFEEALYRVNYIDQVTDDFLKEDVRKILLTGGTPISRGGFINVRQTVQFADEDSFSKAMNLVTDDKNFKIDKQNLTISYNYSPGAKKQGKMDVMIKVPDANIADYRISAKHWTHGSGDLGWTSIDAGMARACGSVLDMYKLAILTPGTDEYGDGSVPAMVAADVAHDLAQIALKSDIVMGLNQGVQTYGGLADVLVIKTPSYIRVYDAATLTLNGKLSNYNPAGLEAKMESIYNSLGTSNRTQSYLLMATSYLNNHKVTMNLSTRLK